MTTTRTNFETMVGDRVKLARKEAGLTQEALSDRLGFKDRQILSNIESGKRKVSADELLALMEALGKAMDFFTDPYLIAEQRVLSWRAKRKPQVLDIYEEKTRSVVSSFCRFADLLGESFSPISCSLRLTPRSSYEDAWIAGEALVNTWELGERPAEQINSVLEKKCGMFIFHVDPPEEVSGAACRWTKINALFVNRNEPAGRRNFTTVHEVFHLLTWDNMPPDRIDLEFEDQNRAPRTERLADNFAIALLTPRAALKAVWGKRQNLEIHTRINETAKEFHVSSKALYWRLRSLGWLSDGDALDVDRDKLTWNGESPRKEQKPKQYCEAFVDYLYRVLDDGLVSARKAAGLLDCDIEDISDLCAEYGKRSPFAL